MPDQTTLSSHCTQLAKGSRAVYRVFDVPAASALDVEGQRQIRAELAKLVDFILWQEIRVDATTLCNQAERLISQDFMDAVQCIRAWRKAVAAALPSRAACRAILTSFLDLCEACPNPLRPAFARGIAPLCPYVDQWGETETAQLVSEIGSVGSPERAEALLMAIQGYTETDAQIMAAAIRISACLLRAERNYVVDVLIQTVTVERMMESRDACRLLPALAESMRLAAALDEDCAPTLAASVLAIAKVNISSACAAANRSGTLTKKIPSDRYDSYLRAVEELAAKGNIRLLGFCLNALPKLVRSHAPETMAEFIRLAAEVLDAYGVNAAEAFLRQETQAARESLAD